MATFNITSDAISASNTGAYGQVLTAGFSNNSNWSSDIVVSTVTASGSLTTSSLNASTISASTISGSGSITINSGVPTYNSMGHYYGCNCLSCSSQVSGMGTGAYTTPTYQQYSSGSLGGNVTIEVAPQDEMKSKPTGVEGAHDHIIECRLKVENVKVIAEYFCFHCNEVLHSKVISKLPKSIMNKKCLPRLVKGV